VTGCSLTDIECTLPNRQLVRFAVHKCEHQTDRQAACSVIKDAGDDPDCTHGAELIATVELLDDRDDIEILGGCGVATVTRAGLGLEVGTAAINPVPRKNITEMVRQELAGTKYRGARVVISVPGGEEMAKKTTNARLGLLGGISILGTSGIVRPYSSSAYRASIVQQIGLARTAGIDCVVLTTGGRSEAFAMQLYPDLDEAAFIQAGDFIGAALTAARKQKMQRAVIVGMIGKLSKMADGRTQTHQAGSSVNMEMLSRLAAEQGAAESVQQEILSANTARHVLEICERNNLHGICDLICRHVVDVMTEYVHRDLEIVCHLMDFEGGELGRHPRVVSDE
jgi:cobalt-precorrin-5B (C1)-methyltransferase